MAAINVKEKNDLHLLDTNALLQQSFDQEFQLLVIENLTYNPVSGSMERESVVGQGNAEFDLSYTDGNLTQVDKTVGGVTYRKTLSYTGGNLTEVTAWSQL